LQLFPKDESISPPALINFSAQAKAMSEIKAFKQLLVFFFSFSFLFY